MNIDMGKYLKFIVAFIFFFNKTYAQHNYIPIPVDSAVWITEEEVWNEGSWPPLPHNFLYTVGLMQGVDTIVNGKKYYSYVGEFLPAQLPIISKFPAIDGHWIRQDTVNKKVYYLRTVSPPFNEELLYDFSLKKGDTINDLNSSYFSPQQLSPYKAWVDKVDSVYWADGTWRYRWSIKCKYGNGNQIAEAIQIEGMGYVTNFLDNPLSGYQTPVGYTWKILCFGVKGNWLYHINNKWNADCDTLSVKNVLPVKIEDISNANDSKPLLFPNPVNCNGSLKLNSYEYPDKELTITAFDIWGRQVLSGKMLSGISIDLKPYTLTPGLYFFFIRSAANKDIYKQSIFLQ